MKNVLIIGSPNSIHTVNFIHTVVLSCNKSEDITIFSTLSNTDINEDFMDFYRQHDINIIGNDIYSTCRINKMRSVATMFLKTKLLLKHLKLTKHYDYCYILYITWQAAEWITIANKYFSHIISVFWGGDVLRNKRLATRRYTKCLSASEHIVLPNLNTQRVFSEKTSGLFDDKIHVIQYPQKMIDNFLSAEKNFNRVQVRKQFDLPQDKIIVVCGHDATRAERYPEMIAALNRCSAETLSKCYFVFMMTYAPEEYHTYQIQIQELIERGPLAGVVMKNYIAYSDVLNLHLACDIHITTILTDAFSCFLQEEMLAGNILIYGKWLNYYEIENDSFYTFPVDKIDDITETLDDVCDRFEEIKMMSRKNKEGIINLTSEDVIKKEWERCIFHSRLEGE